MFVFFFKQKTAYEMRISDWSSDVCSSDLRYYRYYVDEMEYVKKGSSISDNRKMPMFVFGGGGGTAFAGGAGQGPDALGAFWTPRSEERRVGKECVSTCSYWWSPEHSKKNDIKRKSTTQKK